MIVLHQYPQAFGLPSLSPFCVKVEAFLKMSGLPYVINNEINPRRGPKGKMPYIEDNHDVIPDSSLIIDYLIQKYKLQNFEVSDERALPLKIMVEESLYFILLYSRWVDDEGYRVIEDHFQSLFPLKTGKIFLGLIRRNLKKQAHAQGVSRYSKEDVYRNGVSQIKTLAKVLGPNDFFFDQKISLYDATFYSFLVTILKQPIHSPLHKAVRSEVNLCRFIDRIEKKYFPTFC